MYYYFYFAFYTPNFSPVAVFYFTMADCGCAQGAQTQSAGDCCPPCCPPCCAVPTIPAGAPVQPINPCPPPPMASCAPCCNVQVPLVQPSAGEPCPRPRRRCRYIQPERPKSFKPHLTYKPPSSKMEENTIYKKSYLPVESEKNPAVYPVDNICLGEGKISDNTVNRMSYQGHRGVLPPCPILPCEHNLLGEGPMQDLTTQKHDYVPKPFVRPDKVIPPSNLFSSDCPLSDKTTNRLSYMPVDLKSVYVEPIRPINAIPLPTGKFAESTVHKMSYMPWEPPEKMDMPWARKPKFAPPSVRMDDNTVHKMSYLPPGTYEECDDDCADCVECPENFCPTPAVHRPTNCCAPCCCPKAAC